MIATDNLSPVFFNEALNAAQDGIFIYAKDTTVLYVNDAGCRLCGLEPDMFRERKWKWNELADAGYFYGGAAPDALRLGRRISTEFTNHKGLRLLCTASPILDSAGCPYLVVTNLRDITMLTELREELRRKKQQIDTLKDELGTLHAMQNTEFVHESPNMRQIVRVLERVAPTDMPVLILGDSGVGKSALARRLHDKSARADKNYVVANCGAIPPSLCEAEFFGYEKGAFTGASRAHKGLFEEAHGGTLFLDEIGELPPSIQPKLLRVLQEGRIKRLGAQREISVDVRLVAATNQDLRLAVSEGRFRTDLFHRINAITVAVPPLRERPEDVRRLLAYFLGRFNRKYTQRKTFSPRLLAALEAYSWPGNAREMEHLVEKMVVLSTTPEMGCEYLPSEVQGPAVPAEGPLETLAGACARAERDLLTAAAERYPSTRRMAEALGVSHVTVARKLKQYGIRK